MFPIQNLKEIMNLYTEPLLGLAYYYVKDTQIAEDIVQEVFIKMYKFPTYYEERGDIRKYNKNAIRTRERTIEK